MKTLPSTSSAPTGRSAALAGIGFMLAAVFLFALNSAAGKWLVSTYPVGEFMGIQSSPTLLLFFPSLSLRKGRLRQRPRPGLQIVRVVLSQPNRDVLLGRRLFAARDSTTFYLAGPIT